MSIVPSGEEVFHGFPPSADHRVDNIHAGRWAKYLQGLIEAGGLADAQFFATKAAMDADLAHDDKSRAVVYGDGANNGVYLKSGASGTGSWSRILEYLPGYQIVSATDAGAGTANAIVATAAPSVSYTDGAQLIIMNISAKNTTDAVTVAFDGGAALDVKTASGGDPGAGNLVAGSTVIGVIRNSATEFQILSDGSAVAKAEAAQAAAETAQAAAEMAQAGSEAAESGAETARTQAELAATAAGATLYDTLSAGETATSDGDVFLVATTPGVQVYRNDTGSGTLLGYLGEVLFDDVSALLAWDPDTYPATGLLVRTRAEGFPYEVAASGASDHHVTTAGGVKLYVLPRTGGVNVRAFGAVGDGVTDDTAAIQAALATERSVFFPSAEYVISSDLNVYSNTVIDMNGSTLKGDGFLLSGVSNVIIRDGRIENNGTTYPVAMEINNGSNNISLENLTAYQVSEGFRFNGTGATVQHIRTNNLRVEQCKGTPYYHYNSYDVQHMNISTYNAPWGFNMVTGNRHTQVVNASFVLGSSSTTPTGDDSWYNVTPEHGIYCHSSFDCQFVNLHTRGWNRSAGAAGIKIRDFDTFKINNGIIEDASLGAGLFIQAGGSYNYLRNVVISSVQFKNNSSDIFINDYVLGGDEMEVKFVGCDFPDRQGFNCGAGSAGSVLEVNGCNFHLGAKVFGGWSGDTVITNCVFHTATSQALTIVSNCQVDNCTFFDWNTAGNTTGGSPATELLPACISSLNGRNIKILNCNFKQDTKRRVAFYGTAGGSLADNQIVNCFGGGDVYAYQSGGASNIYMSGCTNYSDTLAPNSLTLQSAGNNIKLNDDTTVTSY